MDHDSVTEQHRLYPHVKLATAAFDHPHLPSLAERHFLGEALQSPYYLVLQLATVESNVLSREFDLRLKRGTYSL